MQLYHGSHETVATITATGVFGGVFASADRRAAESHGDVLHIVTSPRHLTDYELNYEIEGAYDVALSIVRGDEKAADCIMSAGCETDDADPETGLEMQRLRGVLAARLGFTSVEMLDEHGATVLCLSGCAIQIVADGVEG